MFELCCYTPHLTPLLAIEFYTLLRIVVETRNAQEDGKAFVGRGTLPDAIARLEHDYRTNASVEGDFSVIFIGCVFGITGRR